MFLVVSVTYLFTNEEKVYTESRRAPRPFAIPLPITEVGRLQSQLVWSTLRLAVYGKMDTGSSEVNNAMSFRVIPGLVAVESRCRANVYRIDTYIFRH
jgi:hypothetical protein